MKKALLVIDMQNVCVGNNHAAYFKYNNKELVQNVNEVIDTNKDSIDYVFTKYEGNAFTNSAFNEFLKKVILSVLKS